MSHPGIIYANDPEVEWTNREYYLVALKIADIDEQLDAHMPTPWYFWKYGARENFPEGSYAVAQASLLGMATVTKSSLRELLTYLQREADAAEPFTY